MNREEKVQQMVHNYLHKRDQSKEVSVMDFHQKHLLLFLNRFRQLLARFEAGSSSLLSHDIFLVVEAATIVAKSDWSKYESANINTDNTFREYFSAFDELAAGLGPLDRAAAACIEALEMANNH
jgi:hypothetical protein